MPLPVRWQTVILPLHGTAVLVGIIVPVAIMVAVMLGIIVPVGIMVEVMLGITVEVRVIVGIMVPVIVGIMVPVMLGMAVPVRVAVVVAVMAVLVVPGVVTVPGVQGGCEYCSIVPAVVACPVPLQNACVNCVELRCTPPVAEVLPGFAP